MSEIVQARRSFITDIDGKTEYVYSGHLAHDDHDVVKRHPEAFRPLKVRWSTEKKQSSEPKAPAPKAEEPNPAVKK